MFQSNVIVKCKNRVKVNSLVFGCGFTINDHAVLTSNIVNPACSYMICAREIPLMGRLDPNSVKMTAGNMFAVFRYVFDRVRKKYATPDTMSIIELKINVIENRMIDDRSCLICWEPIHSADCIVSTCCFATYCYRCMSVYADRIDSKDIVLHTIAPCCGMFSMLPRYGDFYGIR